MSFQQGHALLIGVGRHQYHSNLDIPKAATDARAVKAVLQDQSLCGYLPERVTLIQDSAATKKGILSALDQLSQVQPTDTVFLFFAGHGGKGTDGKYYLVSHDVRVKEKRVQAGTGISENELLEKLNAIPAKRVFMVFNACHSGNIAPDSLSLDETELSETANPSGKIANALLGSGEGRILIVACRENQYSYIGSGDTTIFTTALIAGLKGDAPNNGGTISAFGLYEYLYHEVKEYVEEKIKRVQEPVLTVIKGVGPFPVALFNGASTLSPFADDSDILEGTATEKVSQRKVERSFSNIINVGSGAVAIGDGATAVGERGVNVTGNIGGSIITGDVNTGGGDFVGRNKKTINRSSSSQNKMVPPLANAPAGTYEKIVEYFDLGGIQELCLALSIDYEQLPGADKRGKASALLNYCERNGQVKQLLAICGQKKPHIKWK